MFFHFKDTALFRGGNIGSSFLENKKVVEQLRKNILCPCCGKLLFKAEEDTKGAIYAWCKNCKREIKIKLEPMSRND